MKKWEKSIATGIVVIIALWIWFLVSVVPSYAAGTVVVTGPTKIHNTMFEIVFTCTADSGDGTYPDTAIDAAAATRLTGYWLSHAKVTPGATGPTADSDLYISVGGTDILKGNGVNIVDEAVDGYAVPYGSGGDAQYPMSGNILTLSISNNAVHSAVVVVTLIFDK
jgi:hypothetical protein